MIDLVKECWKEERHDMFVSEYIIENKQEVIEFISEELEYYWEELGHMNMTLPEEFDGHMSEVNGVMIEFQLYHNENQNEDKWFYSIFFYEKDIFGDPEQDFLDTGKCYEWSLCIEPSMIKTHFRDKRLEELGIV
jgi:hypothetical protein